MIIDYCMHGMILFQFCVLAYSKEVFLLETCYALASMIRSKKEMEKEFNFGPAI